MDEQDWPSARRTFLFQAAMTGLAVVSGIVTVFQAKALWAALIFAALMIAAQYLVYHRTRQGVHEFPSEDAPQFCEYFRKWYSQEGTHRIFCKDLDWLDNPRNANVKATLVSQGSNVKIYVSDDRAAAVTEIRNGGGEVYLVPQEMVRIQMKFSLHAIDHTKKLIVRRKAAKVDTVRFVETGDSQMIGLAQTVMAACIHLSQPASSGKKEAK